MVPILYRNLEAEMPKHRIWKIKATESKARPFVFDFFTEYVYGKRVHSLFLVKGITIVVPVSW